MVISGKDFLKSHVLSWRRNVYSDWEDVTSSGRAFQILGPATGKARLPTVCLTSAFLARGRRPTYINELPCAMRSSRAINEDTTSTPSADSLMSIRNTLITRQSHALCRNHNAPTEGTAAAANHHSTFSPVTVIFMFVVVARRKLTKVRQFNSHTSSIFVLIMHCIIVVITVFIARFLIVFFKIYVAIRLSSRGRDIRYD